MKNIIIIGATSGIGNALVQQLNTKVSLYLSGRTHKNLDAISHQHFAQQDVTNSPDYTWLPEQIDGLVYCPGTINLKPFHRLTEEDYLHDFQVNVAGAVSVLRAALPALKKSGSASVVLFSSVAAQTGMPFHASIAISKAGVEALGKSLASEWAVHGIRVNVIAPSLTATPLAENLINTPEKKEASAKRHPLKRIGSAAEIASLAAYLLADEAAFITGQVITADGGLGSLR